MKRIMSITIGSVLAFAGFIACTRMTSPKQTVHAAGGFNLVVLCASCAPGNGNDRDLVGTVVLDQNTGKVWHYPESVLFGKTEPRLLGKMTEVGKALETVKQ